MLAAIISKKLADKKIGKSQFAEMVKKKPSVITRWLSGTHNFTSDTISDIGLVLGINLFNLETRPKEVVYSVIVSANQFIENIPLESKSTNESCGSTNLAMNLAAKVATTPKNIADFVS
jgi:hypothetical protein